MQCRAVFTLKYWRYEKKVPKDQNFILNQGFDFQHFYNDTTKNGGFNGGFFMMIKATNILNIMENRKPPFLIVSLRNCWRSNL